MEQNQATSKPASDQSSFQKLRAKRFQSQISNDSRHQVSQAKIFLHQLSAIVFTRAVILGPLERMKIIMQVKQMAQFVNPADKPKNFLDLSSKITLNQGIVAFYRGNNALIYKLTIQHSLKFLLYEHFLRSFSSSSDLNKPSLSSVIAASSLTALLTTTLAYPLDLSHGRMAADMSKKPSVLVDKNAPKQQQKHRLYSSVNDCLLKTKEETGVTNQKKNLNLFKGLPSALLAQVPYTVILMASFEGFSKVTNSEEVRFNRSKDEIPFITKFFTRFGSSTISMLFASSVCYPLDTVKRRMQLNGSPGHKNIYRNDLHCLQKIFAEEGLAKGLYAGFSIHLIKTAPVALLQYIMFQNFKFISRNDNA